ncbi:MAG: SMC-Scp complex subunit ScpB [Clostridia bacterium]|jgi:segregation and condensation protein B|nr:SMC-Scp complex subunit ScpB [Clostridia bacterium]
MEIEQVKAIMEAILFAAGREVKIKEFVTSLEINEEDVTTIMETLKEEYDQKRRGIQIIRVGDAYQMCTKKEYYEFVYPILDKRSKPNLSNAALEILAIIAYNTGVTRAEIEAIRGVNSDATIYKLMEYNLVEEAGKTDAPGKPMSYRTTVNFLKMFGYMNLESLPSLPKYKMDENQQIVIDDILEEQRKDNEEAPNPEREEEIENKD